MAASSMEIYSWLQVSHDKNKGKRISVFKEDEEEDDGFMEMNTSTLDLLGCLTSSASSFSSTSSSASAIELDSGTPPPSGWEKCLDLKTGNIYYLNRSSGVSTPSDPSKAHTADPQWPNSSPSLVMKTPSPPSPSPPPLPLPSSLSQCINLNLSSSSSSSSSSSMVTDNNSSLDLNLNLHLGSANTTLFARLKPDRLKTNLVSNRSPRGVIGSNPAVLSTSSTSSPASSPTTSSQYTNPHGNLGTIHTCSLANLIKLKDEPSHSHHHHNAGHVSVIGNNTMMASRENYNEISDTLDRDMIEGQAMVTVGCANCLMFVMLSRKNPKCPRCGTALLSDSHDIVGVNKPNAAKRPKLALGFNL